MTSPLCDHAQVRAEAARLMELGLTVATIIPVELDILNDKGKPVFTGKNPSFWQADGTPQTISHSQPPAPRQVLDHIGTAEQIGKPIGLAILPGDDCAVADFDPKDYPGGVDECRADVNRLLREHPELRGTRMECTPSGGVHIYVRVADWSDFTKPDGKPYGQFTTTPGAQLRGEVLAGTRVSVTAPTRIQTSDRDGAYVLKGEPYNLIEVPTLSAIGIYPVGRRDKPATTSTPKTSSAPAKASIDQGKAPALKALLAKPAQSVLDGKKPYGDDRSANLTGFAREVYGVENWLKANGRPYQGSADALITLAIDVLGVADKADRVLETITRADCNWLQGDQRKAQRRYKEVSSTAEALTMAEVGDRLRESISEGISGAELATLVAELAAASEQHAFSVQRIAEAISTEQLQAVAVAEEALQLAAERDRQEIGQVLTAGYLLPDSIATAIETRTRYLPCDGPSAVLPFLTTVAGLVKLGTMVEGCAAAGYRVPVNLFACLVGRSGAKKSPIGRLLVDEPTRELRAEMASANRSALDDWREACREVKRGDPKPEPPQLKRVMVSDYTGEALAAQLQTQEESGLGLLINRDELSGLFGSLNAYRGGRGADEQQLLELFDGGGLTSLRVQGGRTYSRSQLSIWGSTQPDVLRQLVANGDATGLWARFLFVPLQERAVPLPLDTNATENAEVEAAAATLANVCATVYRLPPEVYRLAPAAAERFRNYEWNRQQAALKATISAQSALYGKSAGKVLRLAGVLHLLQISTRAISGGAEIEPDTIERATALVDHLDAWALSLHAEVAAGGVRQLMRTIHRAAELAGKPIRWKELMARLSTKQRKETDAAGFSEAARALAAAGYGEVDEGKRGAISYRAIKALP